MAGAGPGVERAVREQSRSEVRRPAMYKVLLHNDHYTTMEFVVMVLEDIFNKNFAEAVEIMLHVHKRGYGVCGVYPFEIAETKVAMVHREAEKEGFPLKCSMEPE